MNVPTADVRRVVTFTDSRLARLMLLLAAIMFAVAVLFISTSTPDEPHYLRGWLIGFGGIGLAVWGHFNLFRNAKALLTLSPQGLVLSSLGKDMFIPWREVRGIETVSFSTLTSIWTSLPPVLVPVRLKNVSAVLISRDFYEDEILPTSPVLAHTAVWVRTFRPKGDNLVQVCLHHDLLPATSEEIRKAVAARWYAFRDVDTADAAADAAPDMVAPGTIVSGTAASPRTAGQHKKPKFLVRWGKKT